MTQYTIQTDEYLNTNRSIYEVVMLANKDGVVSDIEHPLSIGYGDSSSVTAFGRVRSAPPRLLGDYRYMYGSGTSVLMNDKTASNGTITVDYTRVVCLQNVTTESGSTAIRQTKQYHSYIPGTTNLSFITFVFDQPKANLVQATGLFDANNGIFLRMNESTPELVIRKNGVDNEVVPQSSWNVDKLNGSYSPQNPNGNPSGIQLDFTKTQILMIDYQWLGVGRVRVGFSVDGKLYYAHYFNHANQTTEPYMFQPSLPVRWEIYNKGVTANNSSLMSICGAVYCEGSDLPSGYSRSASSDGIDITAGASSVTDGHCVVAVKLKNSVVGKPNHSEASIRNWAILSNNDVRYKLVIFEDEKYFSGTVNWIDVAGRSWCQTANNLTMTAGWGANTDYVVVQDGFATGATGVGSGSNQITGINNPTARIFQNYDSTQSQVMALIAYKLKTDASVRGTISWDEIK